MYIFRNVGYFLFSLWLSCLLCATSRIDNKECEKSLHNTFSAADRNRLCPPGSTNAAPGLCAASARSLRLGNDEIVDLCHGVDSIAPAECMKTLSNRDRKAHGKQLCDNRTVSILPAKCFNTLTTHPFKNQHQMKPDAVTSFCTGIEDEGAISCLLAIADINTPSLWSVSMGLLPGHCKESNLYIEQSATSRHKATYVPLKQPERRTLAKKMVESLFKTFVKKDESPEFTNMQNKRLSILACLEELKHISSNGNSPSQTTFQPAAVLKFCLHSNSRNMAPYSTEISLIKGIILERLVMKVEEKEEPEPTEQDYKEMAEGLGEEVDTIKEKWKETHENSPSSNKKRVEEPEYYRNYMAECLVRACQITKKGSSTKVFLNTTQRLDLCDAVDNRNGPVNCIKKVLSESKGDANKLLPDLLVTLCNGAGGMDQAMSQWLRKESRLEEARRRRSLSKDEAIRADAEKERRVRFIGSIQKLGLGPADCFVESGAIGLAHATVEQRVELCVGADGVGPAQCYNRARSIRQIDHSNKLHLCVGASGEYPAQCAIATPNYLDIEEKVTLCAGVGDSNIEESVKCLQVIEGPARALRNAPMKSIGMLSALVRDDAGRTARDMLIHLCSIRGSSHPLAAAACVKSAPHTLDHDDVIRTCTNATSADVLSRVQLCNKLLPRDWTYNEAMRLCGTNANSEDVDDSNNNKKLFRTEKDLINKLVYNTVTCAEQMISHRIYKQSIGNSGSTSSSYTIGHWTREEIIDLCSIEDESGNALMCAQAAKGSASANIAYNAQFINPRTIVHVCRSSKDNALHDDQNPEIDREVFKGSSRDFVMAKKRFQDKVSGHMRDAGSCLTHLASMNIKKIVFAPHVPEMICTSEDPMYVVSCLIYGSAASKAQIEKTDVEACYAEPRRISKASVIRLQSMDGAPQAMAGVHFNLLLSLSDQYDIPFSSSKDQDGSCSSQYAAATTSSDSSSATRVQVAINEDNEQGAVLWGIRSNKTDCGQLFFSSLTISQPGVVKVTLSESVSRATTEEGGHYKDESSTLLAFSIDVQPNPVFGKTSMKCNFVFHSVMTPTNLYATKHHNTEIMEESIITAKTSNTLPLYPSNVYRLLACADILEKWHVTWTPQQHGFHIDYKDGIASIWSGKDLPKLEHTFEKRLGLENGIVDSTLYNDTIKVTLKERQLTKMLRRAYYGKSLLWHPDRWVGMSIYEDIVQETFNAVVEAYEGLQVYINAEIVILKEKLEERRKAAIEKKIRGDLHPANSRVDSRDNEKEGRSAARNSTSFEGVDGSTILEEDGLEEEEEFDEELDAFIRKEGFAEGGPDIIKKITPIDASATAGEDIVVVTPEELAGMEAPVYE